jgi:hypothetical protein
MNSAHGQIKALIHHVTIARPTEPCVASVILVWFSLSSRHTSCFQLPSSSHFFEQGSSIFRWRQGRGVLPTHRTDLRSSTFNLGNRAKLGKTGPPTQSFAARNLANPNYHCAIYTQFRPMYRTSSKLPQVKKCPSIHKFTSLLISRSVSPSIFCTKFGSYLPLASPSFTRAR